MICLESGDITDVERRALELYYLYQCAYKDNPICDRSRPPLRENDIDKMASQASRHEKEQPRPLSELIGMICYAGNTKKYKCESCNGISPHRTYCTQGSWSIATPSICERCRLNSKGARLSLISSKLKEAYNSTKIVRPNPDNYLKDLSFIELIYLKIIVNSNPRSDFIKNGKKTRHGIIKLKHKTIQTISGVKSLDEKVLRSLVKKGAAYEIEPFDEEIENGFSEAEKLSSEIKGLLDPSIKEQKLEILDKSNNQLRDPSHETGLYFNSQSEETNNNFDLNSELDYLIQSYKIPRRETAFIKSAIVDIQSKKILGLMRYASFEYRFDIDISNSLISLISHLARNYSPEVCFRSIMFKASQVAADIHAEKHSKHQQPHLLTSYLRAFVEYMEGEGKILNQTKRLPLNFTEPPLETTITSILSLDFSSWRKLNATEILQELMKNIDLEEE